MMLIIHMLTKYEFSNIVLICFEQSIAIYFLLNIIDNPFMDESSLSWNIG